MIECTVRKEVGFQDDRAQVANGRLLLGGIQGDFGAKIRGMNNPDVILRRTEYDGEAAGETFRAAAPGYPDLAEFIAENVLTVPSDALALAAFSG